MGARPVGSAAHHAVSARRRIARRVAALVFGFALCEGGLRLAAWGFARSGVERDVRGGGVFCVGDSNTEGFGAPAGRSYPDQLRDLFRQAGDPREVLNLGVSGFSTGQILARLEAALERARPSYVVFSGGRNDIARGELFLKVKRSNTPTLLERVHATLSRLLTFRVLEAAFRSIEGVSPTEREGLFPDPSEVPPMDWPRAFEKAASGGAEAVFRWVAHFWQLEEAGETERAFERFLAAPDSATLREHLRLPIEFYRWELAMLQGRVRGKPLDPEGRSGFDSFYARFTRGYAALLEGRAAEARSIFEPLSAGTGNPWAGAYVRLHRAWASLLERDFRRADEELREVLDVLVGLSPPVGLAHALGGTAIAHLLRDEKSRLVEFLARYGEPWGECRERLHASLGREWMAAAEWVDAIKGGGKNAVERGSEARSRFGEKLETAPLSYLASHPGVSFEAIRKDLPLEPLRASLLGATALFFPRAREEEYGPRLRPGFDRLAHLAKRHRFRPILLTYLNDEPEPANALQRRRAGEEGWPLVDLAARYGRGLYTAEGRRRFFAADRRHPNEAGYALVARAVFEKIREVERSR